MTSIILILNLVAAAGLLLVALRYLTGAVPLDYHATMFEKAGAPAQEIHVDVLRALYRSIGAAFLAIVVALVALAWFAGDQMWSRIAIVVMGLVAGLVSANFTYSVEKKTGVRTPWRAAIVILLVLVIAFVLPFFA